LKYVLDLSLDPWELLHSESTVRVVAATSAHLKEVSTFYGTRKQHYCMVLGKSTNCDIICAHIWPRCTQGKGLEVMSLSREDVNHPRNFLRLHRAIEKAFDKKRLYFDHDSSVEGSIQLIVRIVDPSLLTETFEANNVTYSFADLQDRPFTHHFTPLAKPYLRLIALHASHTIEKAQSFSWVPAGDIPARRDRLINLARLSLDDDKVGAVFKLT
jgi:hypothetical protein